MYYDLHVSGWSHRVKGTTHSLRFISLQIKGVKQEKEKQADDSNILKEKCRRTAVLCCGWLHSSFHDLNDFIILHFVRLFPSVHSWLLSVTQSYHLLIKFEEESLALDLMQ